MRWQDINFENRTWYLHNQARGVHLVNTALNILIRREKENNNKSIWVFPNNSSKSGHISHPYSVWKKICKSAGIDGLRIHDLRITHGIWMRKVGADREIIRRALGYKSIRSTKIYDSIAIDQVKVE